MPVVEDERGTAAAVSGETPGEGTEIGADLSQIVALADGRRELSAERGQQLAEVVILAGCDVPTLAQTLSISVTQAFALRENVYARLAKSLPSLFDARSVAIELCVHADRLRRAAEKGGQFRDAMQIVAESVKLRQSLGVLHEEPDRLLVAEMTPEQFAAETQRFARAAQFAAEAGSVAQMEPAVPALPPPPVPVSQEDR